MPRTFQEAFMWSKAPVFWQSTVVSQTSDEAWFTPQEDVTPESLQGLWVDTSEIDAKVDQEIETTKNNTRTQEQFQESFTNAKNSWKFKDMSDDEIIDGLLNSYKNKWLTIEWIDIDEELWNTTAVSVPEDTEEEWPSIWETVAAWWKAIKVEWSEEFWLVQTAKDLLTAWANLPWDTVEWIWELIDLATSLPETAWWLVSIFSQIKKKNSLVVSNSRMKK